MIVRWHRALACEVPPDNEWLTPDERALLAGLPLAKRRDDWRLGRWTAKALLAAVLDVPVDRVGVRAADDGAPEAFVDGTTAGVSLSLSHRDRVAVAAVAPHPTVVGIDLETLETRSDAFVREWLSDEERATLPSAGTARDVRVLCSWTGKEASAKVLRGGLRLAVRHAVVIPSRSTGGLRWSPLRVTWAREQVEHNGWWRVDDRSVIAVVTDPPTDPPVDLGADAAS
jgi:4'-phosphopantetheinyl transferase